MEMVLNWMVESVLAFRQINNVVSRKSLIIL